MADADENAETNGMQLLSVPKQSRAHSQEELEQRLDGVPSVHEIDYQVSRGRLMKNVIVVSLAFMLLFTAHAALESLQSSLNKEGGLGVYGLVFIYSSMIVSCLFLSTPIISFLGCKWSLVVAMATYVLYVLANFHAVWATMVPASLLLGLGGALLWSAKCTYLTETATKYAQVTGEDKDVILHRFFGIFFGLSNMCLVWGSLVSSLVLSQNPENITEIPMEILARCGAAYCTGDENIGNTTNAGLEKPPESKILVLCGTFMVCGVIGVGIVTLFLDNLDSRKSLKSLVSTRCSFSNELFVATFKQMRKPQQFLLIPLTVYCALCQGFVGSDFTKSYVSCSNGMWNVGYVMMCFGISNSLSSIVFGRLAKYVDRAAFFTFAMLGHYGLLFAFLFWQPTPDELVVLFVLAGLWGSVDAIWMTQINALYGVMFEENREAAFSNYRLWRAIGFILAYVFSVQLCVHIKLYILMGTLCVSMLGYFAVELIQRRSEVKSQETPKSLKSLEVAKDMLGSALSLHY